MELGTALGKWRPWEHMMTSRTSEALDMGGVRVGHSASQHAGGPDRRGEPWELGGVVCEAADLTAQRGLRVAAHFQLAFSGLNNTLHSNWCSMKINQLRDADICLTALVGELIYNSVVNPFQLLAWSSGVIDTEDFCRSNKQIWTEHKRLRLGCIRNQTCVRVGHVVHSRILSMWPVEGDLLELSICHHLLQVAVTM